MKDQVSLRMPLIAVLAIAFTVATGAAAPARASVDEAKATVESMANNALRILDRNQEVSEREEKFRELFRQNFAVQQIGQFVLGRRWPQDDAAKRQEFLDVFERYVVKFYTVQLNKYAGEDFNVTGGREQGGGRYLVSSEVIPPEGDKVNLEWELEDTPDGPKVVDLRVQNISLRITQRDEFRSVIKARGGTVDGLIEALEEKIAQLEERQG